MAFPVTVQNDRFKFEIQAKANEQAAKSGLTQLKDYLGSANGAYKCADLPNKICKFGKEVALAAGSPRTAMKFQVPGSVFSRVAGAFILPYAAFTAIEVKENVDKVSAKGGASAKNVENLVKSSFTAITAFCHTLGLFVPGNPVLKTVSTVTDLGDDGIELKQQACAWSEANEILDIEGLTPEVTSAVKQTRTHKLLGMIKSVLSVVGGIFAVLALIASSLIVPGLVTATIGLAAIVFTFITKFYGENMDNKLKIDREVLPLATA